MGEPSEKDIYINHRRDLSHMLPRPSPSLIEIAEGHMNDEEKQNTERAQRWRKRVAADARKRVRKMCLNERLKTNFFWREKKEEKRRVRSFAERCYVSTHRERKRECVYEERRRVDEFLIGS